jgi:hypothetical protein
MWGTATLPRTSRAHLVRKAHLLSHFILNMIILTRQARDKYRKRDAFLVGSSGPTVQGVEHIAGVYAGKRQENIPHTWPDRNCDTWCDRIFIRLFDCVCPEPVLTNHRVPR